MDNQDILKIRKILQNRNRNDLADLLKYSYSVLNESSTYGSYWYSTLSTFHIFSPLKQNEELSHLSEQDNAEIFNALLVVYPHKENSPEIRHIDFEVDFELEKISLVEANELERVSFNYIHEQIRKCEYKITEKDYEGAVTNSRTLLESICLFIYDNAKDENYEYKGDLLKLYKDVSKILRLNPADYAENCLKQILSGVFSIINGISTLRNDFSDAHGHSPNKAYRIDERHSKLAVNLSKSIAEYLFLTYEKNLKTEK